MASNTVDIAIICPLKFQTEGYANPGPYNTHFDDDWAYPDTIPDMYEQAPYIQPFQNNDIIYLQIISNFAPHNVELLDCSGNQIDTFAFAYKPTSIEITGQKVYEVSIALNTYAANIYQIRIKSGSPVINTVVSEWFEVAAFHENSVLIKYKHNENDYDVAFETGIEFMIRTFGGFPPEQYKPGADRTVFIDQSRDEIILDSRTWDIDKFIIGGPEGVPKYFIKKMNKICACSSTTYDGKQFVVNEGAQFEPVTEQYYPMAGWGIDLRPASNKGRKRFEVDGNSNNPTTVVFGIQTDLFGDINGPGSSNVVQIESNNY
jgi:hypothetical protein